ncbi:hypothetical protein [Aliivibrio kagoshimensis]|uniref:hypothetical protein n=1 Tax=Aliivibrio kagoshimensis TaxID=2910230 RepID=UPI003D11DD90
MKQLAAGLCFTLFSCVSLGESDLKSSDSPPLLTAPLVQFNVSVDTNGVEKAIQGTNQSMADLVEALQLIGDNRDLTPKQMEMIALTVNNVNQLAISSTGVVEKLPETIEQAKQAVVTNSQLFYQDLKFKVLLLLGGVVAALAVVIICLYWFVIKPMQHTIVTATANVMSMAKTIELTATSLEQSNKTHVKILQKLEQESPKSTSTE